MDRLRTLVGAALVGALCVPAAVTTAAGDPGAPADPRPSTAAGRVVTLRSTSPATPPATPPATMPATMPSTPPATAPARTDAPGVVAVVGDSISQGTGSNGPGSPGGSIGSPRPTASWATGTHDGLDSYAQRLSVLQGRDVVAHDLSANGASIRDDLVEQIRRVPEGTDLVLVQMGGNDLCRPSLEQMTPLEVARDEIRAALDWMRDHRPDTLVLVASIPDIYSLWYVRGASHRGEQYPFVGFVVSGREGPRAPRSFVENNNKRTARLLWDTLGVVPCQSLLARPNVPRNAGPTPDPTHPAEQRRLAVRAHNIALNEIWVEECEAMLRCLHDSGAVFDVVANRDTDGMLLADKADWTFVDADISTQDHFHPSFSGQRKLAETMWSAGPDWTDTTPPTGYTGIVPAQGVDGPSPDGWYSGPVAVEVRFRDEAGVRGIEHRVRRAGDDAEVPGWTTTIGEQVTIGVVHEGDSWVEVRGLDMNGNLGESLLVPVRIDRRAPTATIVSPADGEEMVLGAPVVARYGCEDDGSGILACDAPVRAGRYVDTSQVGAGEVQLVAIDAAGNRTTVTHEYYVRYAWSGTTAPLEAGHPRRFVVGQPIPVHFVLSDAHGRPIPEADVEISLVGPSGRERPAPARLGALGVGWRAWSAAHGGHAFLLDTRALVPGVWDIVIRPDDGAEHRINLVLVERDDTVDGTGIRHGTEDAG